MLCRNAPPHLFDLARARLSPLLLLFFLGVAVPNARGQVSLEGNLFGSAYPRTNLSVGYQVDPQWPRHECKEHWGAMSGIAIDAQDRVWTLNRGVDPVQVFDREGTLLASWGEGHFGKPHQIRFDPEGNLWITDVGRHVVEKFSMEGQLLLTIGTPGEAGDDSRHFDGPTDVAITPTGELFVTDGYGNNRVVHLDRDGTYLRSWGKLGAGPGEFSLPHSIAIDSRGRLYLADRNNARVQVFDQTGRVLDEWRNLMVPWTLWMTGRDELYVCGSSPMRWRGKLPIPGIVLGVPPKDQLVLRFDLEGRVQSLWTFPLGKGAKSQPGALDWVHAIAVDSRGDLFLGDIQGARAQRFLRLSSDDGGPIGRGRGGLAGEATRDDSIQKAATP